ncbi:hypothetical protein [Flammeovirga agarivorans]|uniref:Uncharacterized protein n=1 Tax=Flammeovirga agarivorans TaxID=2726742 RepID=A0A7X8SKC9_9BACT|nr:hypothetical protein [Flammeovirga agarivorans]NLR91737.1 hypothetical protein [Flammeovirga agarivorans]
MRNIIFQRRKINIFYEVIYSNIILIIYFGVLLVISLLKFALFFVFVFLVAISFAIYRSFMYHKNYILSLDYEEDKFHILYQKIGSINRLIVEKNELNIFLYKRSGRGVKYAYIKMVYLDQTFFLLEDSVELKINELLELFIQLKDLKSEKINIGEQNIIKSYRNT